MNDDGASHDCCAEAIRERFKRCLLEHYKPMTRQFFVTLTDKILLSFSIALASINLVLTKLGTHVPTRTTRFLPVFTLLDFGSLTY